MKNSRRSNVQCMRTEHCFLSGNSIKGRYRESKASDTADNDWRVVVRTGGRWTSNEWELCNLGVYWDIEYEASVATEATRLN